MVAKIMLRVRFVGSGQTIVFSFFPSSFFIFFYFFAKHSHSNLLSRISVCFPVRQIFARFYSRRSKNLGETTRLIASSFPILKIEISEKYSRSKNFLKSQHSRGKGVAVPLYFAIAPFVASIGLSSNEDENERNFATEVKFKLMKLKPRPAS